MRNRSDSFDEFSSSSASLLSPSGAKRRSGSFKLSLHGSFEEDEGQEASKRNVPAATAQSGSAVVPLAQRRRGSSFSLSQTSQKDDIIDEGNTLVSSSGTPLVGSARRRSSVNSLQQLEAQASPRTAKKPFNI